MDVEEQTEYAMKLSMEGTENSTGVECSDVEEMDEEKQIEYAVKFSSTPQCHFRVVGHFVSTSGPCPRFTVKGRHRLRNAFGDGSNSRRASGKDRAQA